MLWEQIVALLKAQGLSEVPLDVTDPRVTTDTLAELAASAREQYREVRKQGSKSLPLARDLTVAINAIQSEMDARAEAAKLDAAVDGPEPDGDDGDGDGSDAEDTVTKDLETTTPLTVVDGKTTDGTLTEDDKSAKELAAAATAALSAPGAGQPESEQGGASEAPSVHVPLLASATMADVEFGHEVGVDSLARIMPEVVSQFRAGGPSKSEPERRVRVASVLGYADRPGADDSMVLSAEKGPQQNTAILRKILADHTAAVKEGRDPKTAATFCAPYDVIREVKDSTDTSTPLRDSLPFVPFSHGGFTFNAGVQLSDVTGAVDEWTPTDQDNVDANDDATWKPCYEIVCPTPTTLVADNWLTACVSWKVGMDINNPENVADVFRKVEGVRARQVEQYLLTKIDPLLTNYHYTAVVPTGISAAIPDLIAALVSSFSHAGYDHRLRDDISYTMYLDTGMLGTLVVDRVRTAFGIGREQETVMSYIMSMAREADLPIDRVVQLKERQVANYKLAQGESYGAVKANGNPYAAATYPAAAGAAAIDGPDLLTHFRVRLVPTSEVFAFGTGEIRTGVRQDFAMARQNKVGWFVEEAIQVGKFGVSPWFALNIDLCPSGARTGWIDPTDIDCASTLGS